MLWPRADIGRGARGQRIQPWCPGSASLPSSGPAKPFLLQGPADPSSSSGVSAYGAETPRLQINLWLQLEQGERGRAWSRGGGRRRGSSRQAEQLSFMPCLLLQEPAGALDWETRHRSKIGLLQLQIQSCSSGLSQGQSPKASQSPSPPLCWTGKKHHRVSYAVPEAT